MTKHPKTYENVFSLDNIASGRENLIRSEKIFVEGIETETYRLLFKDFLKSFYEDLFLQCVKLSWLRRKFTYNGHAAKMPVYASTRYWNGMFVRFLRKYVGHDIQVITKSYFFPKLETYYFDEFFPEFMYENPFKNPDYYKFPYQNISLEYLTTVYQLDDRFGLLEEANLQKMSYAVFLDYVLNHVNTENELLGRERYFLTQSFSRYQPYFFRDSDKNFRPIKGSKRI